ncbi:MAG: M42 family metallopeptidase [Actinobacteria bacterium]|nr:M42 family metallopeptidase [Actinomycetota bacterium]
MSSLNKISNQLKELIYNPAPAGFEDSMIRYMSEKIRLYGIETQVDSLGNVVARLGGSCSRPRIMILAHMDEVGLIVRKIEKNGFLRFDKIGGVSESTLPGCRVLVIKEDGDSVNGVIGSKSHHLVPVSERGKPIPFDELYIDIGCSSYEKVLSLGVNVGSPVVYARDFFQNELLVFGPAIDNRGGCLVLLQLVEKLLNERFNPEVFLVASVQEEYNLRGVLPVARMLNPDLAVAIDVAVACDTPDLSKTAIKVGYGPVINAYSFHGRGTLGGVIPNPKLKKLMIDAATKAGIPIQLNVFYGGLTDASFLQLENKGIPSIEVGFPARYTHTPLECADLRDIEKLIELLIVFIITLPSEIDLSRY